VKNTLICNVYICCITNINEGNPRVFLPRWFVRFDRICLSMCISHLSAAREIIVHNVIYSEHPYTIIGHPLFSVCLYDVLLHERRTWTTFYCEWIHYLWAVASECCQIQVNLEDV